MRRYSLPRFLAVGGLIFFLYCLLASLSSSSDQEHPRPNSRPFDVKKWCPLPAVHSNPDDGLEHSSQLESSDSLKLQIERLSAAVNVPTINFQDNGRVGEDERWKVFAQFHIVLERLFPLVHEHAELEKINTYGLLYTFQGSDRNAKPILFMAHQDVVPPGSTAKWTQHPFQGHYDGKFLWGRGSADCKNTLIGLLSVMEHLLSQSWSLKRTVIFSFGFDGETTGLQGAWHLSAHLEKRYGKDSIAMILDEGGMGIETMGNYAYALPAVTEKGCMDIMLKLEVPGGHSSRPPAHSGIGVMAEMIVELEKHPYKPRLTQRNPYRGVLECQVRYTPNDVESWLKRDLISGSSEQLLGMRLSESRGNGARFSLQTSQAIDIIKAGEKSNQLPDEVNLLINYRIAPHDGIGSVKQKIVELVAPIARKYRLGIQGFGFEEEKTDEGLLILNSRDGAEPAPIAPRSFDNAVWELFSGTIRQVFEDTEHFKGKTVVPVGDIMNGNTDTMHYWNLTHSIYRFSPARNGTQINVHTVDERLEMKSHLEAMRLYYDLIRNFDKADVEGAVIDNRHYNDRY